MITENLVRLFESSIKNNWELPAWTDYNEQTTMTYGEVGEQVARLHLLFDTIRLEKGAKISLVGKNGINWCTVYVAAVTYGAVIVPILQDFNPNDVQHIINHSDSQLLFVSDHLWETLEEEKISEVRAVFSLNDFRCLHQKDGEAIQKANKALPELFAKQYPDGYLPANVLYPTIPNTELACISYTSGTTGFSKGVMIPHNALVGNVVFGIRTKLLYKGCRMLAFLPLAHAYGCAYDFLTAFCVGSHTTFLGKMPAPKILLKAFSEIRPATVISVPLIIEKIYKKQIQPMLNSRSMRWALSLPLVEGTIYSTIRKKINAAFGDEFSQVIIGGAALNPEVEEFFHKIGFHYTVGYGMTECAPIIAYARWDEYVPFSVGQIQPGMEVKIDSDDPYKKAGEILVRGEHVMLGYYKNEEATAQVLSEDGWLRTGDMGTIDQDNNIFIRGRNKTMLLSGSGQNIYPEEIEAKLNNMPFVNESLVIENAQNKLVALVCPDYEAIDEAKISDDDLQIIMESNRQNLNKIVASYENVIAIQLYPNEFEKTPKKSIKRYLYSNLIK
ncbi:MAG: AMP-binding protein [Prevotellaceae bacterium]|jgi:long-chain acyl-CoA synthetase|nr:AMP-binding protein [Prevotellaceae bacterium]